MEASVSIPPVSNVGDLSMSDFVSLVGDVVRASLPSSGPPQVAVAVTAPTSLGVTPNGVLASSTQWQLPTTTPQMSSSLSTAPVVSSSILAPLMSPAVSGRVTSADIGSGVGMW